MKVPSKVECTRILNKLINVFPTAEIIKFKLNNEYLCWQ